jgi:hypothetical protein
MRLTAASLFMGANVLHSLDHVRQGLGRLTLRVIAGGSLLTPAGVVALVLALRAHLRAVAVCLAVGASGARGVSAAHRALHPSALSDPYADRSFDVLLWAVMLAELAAAALLAAVGARMLPGRRDRTA